MLAPLTAAGEQLAQAMVVAIRVRPQLSNQADQGLSQSKRRQRVRLQLSKEEVFPLDLTLNQAQPQHRLPHLGLDVEAAANNLKKNRKNKLKSRLRKLKTQNQRC